MLPLLYIGISTFTLSFSVSNFITSEFLRNRFENLIIARREKLIKPKSMSKVKFNHEIKVRYIPTRSSLSSSTLSQLWYSNNDYKYFKKLYSIETKYNSI